MPTANDRNERLAYWLEHNKQLEEAQSQSETDSDHSADEQHQMVGRAGLKLRDAVDKFHFDFTDAIVLDIGSSTGGFTELALERGATKVIAIEKGTDQMKEPLRSDERVELHEKTDIFTVTKHLTGEVDVVLADVSFVSLRKVLTYVQTELISQNETDWLVMLKPQFEAYPDQLNRGVIRNEKIRRDIIKKFELWLKSRGFVIIDKCDNDIPGLKGNVERFYWLKLSKSFHSQASKRANENPWI